MTFRHRVLVLKIKRGQNYESLARRYLQAYKLDHREQKDAECKENFPGKKYRNTSHPHYLILHLTLLVAKRLMQYDT